jgi:outer membrane protein
MSKNSHLVVYAIIFSGLIALFILQFRVKEDQYKDIANNENIVQQGEINLDTDLTTEFIMDSSLSNKQSFKIAYVNSDTVSKYYKYAQKVQSILIGKRNDAERQIRNKYQSYENLVKDFEKAAPIMGEREKMERAQKIRLLEQEIVKVEQDLSEQLANEELTMTQSYILKTNDYMQDIGKSIGYDYVLSYRVGGPMLYANPNLNITSKVIDLLNEKYQTQN